MHSQYSIMQGGPDVDIEAASAADTPKGQQGDNDSVGLQGLDLLSDYDYIAIFDADFKPDSDFLVSSSWPPAYSL